MTASVLVTGGAGFIGSHLVERLLAEDCQVVILDSLLRGRQALATLLSNSRLALEQVDIRTEPVLRRVVAGRTFDVVYHLAALHYIPECAAHPIEALSVNVLGTQTLLEALKANPPRCLVFASTGDVYRPKTEPHEESDPIGPVSVYGLTKVFGEQLVRAASEGMHDTNVVIARLFNAYGPRETNPHLIPAIIEQLKGGKILRLGNLWPRRDYVHVKDIAEALVVIGMRPQRSGIEVFNVGTGQAYSVEEVVRTLGAVLNEELVVEADQARMRPVERPHLQANAARLQMATSWRPRYGLEGGLRDLCIHEQLVQG